VEEVEEWLEHQARHALFLERKAKKGYSLASARLMLQGETGELLSAPPTPHLDNGSAVCKPGIGAYISESGRDPQAYVVHSKVCGQR